MTGPQDPQDPSYPGRARPLPARVHRRPEPKFGVSLAGIGVALATVGVIVWGGD